MSEILGNLSVAWFSAGAISPFFSHPGAVDFLINFAVSFIMAAAFFIISLRFAKN